MLNLFHNIPDELKHLNQWLCWAEGKIPHNPRTGQMASVTDPSTWGTFEEACAASQHFKGIGFVFTPQDEYAGIDLDFSQDTATIKRQEKIFKEFDSYSEISPSGRGLHIIVKANVSSGRRRSNIELYSSHRFFTMTGNVYLNKPIEDRQELTSILWNEMGGGAAAQVYGGDFDEKLTDEDVIKSALAAFNGDKFNILLNGDWRNLYNSQSEADFAFVDIIAFYTQNRNQIARIFRNSPLGQRDKAQRSDYVQYMTNKAFDRMLPPVDIDGLCNGLEAAKAKLLAEKERNLSPDLATGEAASPEENPYTVPPGLLGAIASFIYQSSVRPVPEIALAAAIALMAGVTGRAYNVSGTGLNQYVLLLAKTGTGKEGMATGIDKLMNAIRNEVPAAKQFVGPAEIASGQALLKYLNKAAPSFVSIIGEFGLKMQQLSHPSANSTDLMLKRVLLDLYNKSGQGKMLQPSIYSQKENNTEMLLAPAVTLLGESTPETFFECVDERVIASGLLPRFTLIEYDGIRPPMNEHHLSVKPSPDLVNAFASLCSYSLKLNVGNENGPLAIQVQMDNAAENIIRNFNVYADDKINNSSNYIARHLWNRAHVKLMKLAALVAVGVNPMNPIITAEYAEWAKRLVIHDIKKLSERFRKGDFGKDSEETKQADDFKRIIKDYIIRDYAHIKSYGVSPQLYDAKIVPLSYISRRLISVASFRLDRIGATNALKKVISFMIECDVIREVGKNDMVTKFNTAQRCFAVVNFDEL